jgi:biopolymer transport protein ExbB
MLARHRTTLLPTRCILTAALLTSAFAAAPAWAWWNKAFTQRTTVVVDTSAQGQETKEAAAALPLAIRLHSGNFDFLGAKADGADLRVLGADDKTPLPHRIERFDAGNELALLWVQLPTVAPGGAANLVRVYAGDEKAAAVPAANPFDAATLAALQFSGPDGGDATGTLKAANALTIEPNGLLAGALKLDGQAISFPAAPRLALAAGGSATVSFWLRADAVDRGEALRLGPLAVALSGDKVAARVGSLALEGGAAKPATWTHVALAVGAGKARLYVDGAPVAEADAALPAGDGSLVLGSGLAGAIDEVQVAGTLRSAAWVALVAGSQGVGGKLVRATREAEGEAGGGGQSYFGILAANLTVDAWVVILLCGLMLVVAVYVMVAKALLIGRTARANQGFLQQFKDARDDLLALGGSAGAAHASSSLYRLYAAGLRELEKRDVGHGRSTGPGLSGASIDAVKAAVDADMVRETHRLNANMVLLTIAIAGGPFLGLLGTVIGVMITFAAIAAAGDVNVNAIAPGIAAALLATVAGLGVAIPSLFGYNYLASRIKNLSADMQIFVDEFITRVAEVHGAR